MRTIVLLTLTLASAPEEDPEAALLEDETALLEEESEEVVVSASRYRQTLRDAPSAVTVITAEEIQRHGWRTIGEAVGSAAGFYEHSDRLYGYLGVRGYAVSGDWNSKVLFLVNGHAVNGNVYYDVDTGSAFNVDLQDVSRIEIVRGPASALYGTNAFFAVVNVVTKGGAHTGGVEVTADVSTNERWRGHASWGRSFENGLDLAFAADGMFSQGDRELYLADLDYTARDLDGQSRFSGFARASWGPWTLQLSHSQRHREFFGAYYSAKVGSADNSIRDARSFAELAYSGELAPGFELAARGYYDWNLYSSVLRYDYPDENFMNARNDDLGSGHRLGADVLLVYTYGSVLRVVAGGLAEHHFGITQRTFDELYGVTMDDERRYQLFSVYGQGEYTPFDALTLVAGVRYDHYDYFGGALSPRAAAVARLSADSTLKLLYGSAFRTPTMFELFYVVDGVLGAPQVEEPERIQAFELVYEHILGDGLFLTGAAYYNLLTGLIGETENESGDPFYANLAGGDAYGAEIGLKKRWNSGAAFWLHYAYQHARYDSPQSFPRAADLESVELTNSPAHLLGARGSLPLLDGKLTLSGEIRYSSDRLLIDGRRTGGIVMLNAGVLAHPTESLTVGAYAFNLLDWTQGVPSPPEWEGITEMPQEGQTFSLRLTGRF